MELEKVSGSLTLDKLKSLINQIIGKVAFPRGVARKINGSSIRFHYAYCRYYPADYEPHKQAFIEKYAKGIVLDLGSHIGLYTVLLSRKADSVVAFEPTDFTRKVLCQTLAFNDCTNVVVRSEGISSNSGVANFYDTGDRVSNANSLLPIGAPTQIQTITIDDLDLRIDFIKMDIEGAELLALRGAHKTLKTLKYMTMEIHPELLHKVNASTLDVLKELAPYSPLYYYQGQEVDIDFLCSLETSFETNVLLNGSS